jgi:DNA-binding transcriptional regulator/RsmH inhibitor MraZ
LESDVIISGAGEWLEIWDPQQFASEMAEADRWQNRASTDTSP